MKTRVGLWTGHKQAIVVALTGKGEEASLIVSRREKQPRRTRGNVVLRGWNDRAKRSR